MGVWANIWDAPNTNNVMSNLLQPVHPRKSFWEGIGVRSFARRSEPASTHVRLSTACNGHIRGPTPHYCPLKFGRPSHIMAGSLLRAKVRTRLLLRKFFLRISPPFKEPQNWRDITPNFIRIWHSSNQPLTSGPKLSGVAWNSWAKSL